MWFDLVRFDFSSFWFFFLKVFRNAVVFTIVQVTHSIYEKKNLFSFPFDFILLLHKELFTYTHNMALWSISIAREREFLTDPSIGSRLMVNPKKKKSGIPGKNWWERKKKCWDFHSFTHFLSLSLQPFIIQWPMFADETKKTMFGNYRKKYYIQRQRCGQDFLLSHTTFFSFHQKNNQTKYFFEWLSEERQKFPKTQIIMRRKKK